MGTNGVRTKESDLSNRVRPNDLNFAAESEMALLFVVHKLLIAAYVSDSVR